MQVDVKPNLEESLKTLVKGELLEGENAYHCEKCNKKVRALKRMSIKKLPNYLIICLKRFEYNFETDQKFKVNSCCEFPR
jgi:ubiquitin carboxyl-terminal hydrolase 9/24